MAIGSAKVLGFDIPRNFNMPYISKTITEFWRRWHISLSTWLREYLYIALGGNRKGKTRQYVNLMIVMLLGGLWHGASWNFVVWGGLHGVALAIHKIYMDYVRRGRDWDSPLYTFASWLLTFVYVIVAWVFFRAADFSISTTMVAKMFGLTDTSGIAWMPISLLLALPVLVGAHLIGKRNGNYPIVPLNTFWGLFVLFFTVLGLVLLAPLTTSPFIYFQF
jgi:alginate O-acetyltransferase complex protein AlgI